MEESRRARRSWFTLTSVLAVTAVAVAACGGSSGDEQAASANASGKTEAKLVWWTAAGDDSTLRMMSEAFKGQHSTKVEPYKDVTAPLIQKFQAGFQRGDGPDVLFLSDATAMKTLAENKMLADYTPAGVKANYPDSLKRYGPYAYPYALIVFGVGYNTKLAGPAAPDRFPTWDSVLDPKYTGKFGMADPNLVGGALQALWVMKENDTPEQWSSFLSKLGALKPKFYESNFPAANALASGEIAVAWIYDEAIDLQVRAGAPVAYAYPDGTPASYGMAAISSKAKSPVAARKFMDFMTSVDGQDLWSSTYGDTPANPDAKPQRAMAKQDWYQSPGSKLHYFGTPPTPDEKEALLDEFNQAVGHK